MLNKKLIVFYLGWLSSFGLMAKGTDTMENESKPRKSVSDKQFTIRNIEKNEVAIIEQDIQDVIDRYKIDKNQKYFYLGRQKGIPLSPYAVVYRNNLFPKEDNKFIFINMRFGIHYGYKIVEGFFIEESKIAKDNYKKRIADKIIDFEEPTLHSKGIQDARFKLDYAKRIVSEGVCESVAYVGLYDTGKPHLFAICGNGWEILQTLKEVNALKPIPKERSEVFYK